MSSRWRIIKWALGILSLFIFYNNCSPKIGSKSESTVLSVGVPEYECAQVRSLRKPFPRTIDEATRLINELPKPLSLPCFLSSLEPSLSIFAVESTFSAQPSDGPDSPRIFIFKSNLIMSLVPSLSGESLLEFSQITGNMQSIKGELKFPLNANIPLSAPFDRIKDQTVMGGGTSCRFCHRQEVRVTNVGLGEAYMSELLPPDPFHQVKSSKLRGLADLCDARSDAYRCAILRYLMWSGKAYDKSFPLNPILSN